MQMSRHVTATRKGSITANTLYNLVLLSSNPTVLLNMSVQKTITKCDNCDAQKPQVEVLRNICYNVQEKKTNLN